MLRFVAVTVAPKTGILSVIRLEEPDPAKNRPGSHVFVKFKHNKVICAAIRALHDYKISKGNPEPKLFAGSDAEFFFPEKATPANAKAAFDCTNKDMPLFPFAATAQVSRGASGACLRSHSHTRASPPSRSLCSTGFTRWSLHAASRRRGSCPHG